MTTAVRPRKTRTPKRNRPPTDGWWGDGQAPWERWPGVTIPLEATWTGDRWESLDGLYYYDKKEADRAVDFFPLYLNHHMGEFAGAPFTLMPYQELLLTRPIFGWRHVETSRRRFQRVFAFLPKGAGKSPWGAGTGLYLTLCDGEAASEVYAVAGDTKQARVVHDNARIMVEESPELLQECEVLRDSIYHAETRSRYQVLSSDASTKHGFRPHGIIFDEIHNQKDRNLYEALEKSMKKRRQPLLIIITHAGEDTEGIAYEEYGLAKKVLSGTSPAITSLPVIFEAANDEPWDDEKTWRRVNPGHGITVQHNAIVEECQRAKDEPRKLNDFKRFTLNQWVNAASAWMPVEWWDACPSTVDDDRLRELNVTAGLDMSQRDDLTALVLTFKEPLWAADEAVEVVGTNEFGDSVKRSISLNYRIHVVPFFWIPKDTMREHEKTDRVPYSQWVEKGIVRVTGENVIDHDRIFKDITGDIMARFPKLRSAEIAFDPAFANEISTKMFKEGFRMLEVLQGYKHLSEPSMVFEAMVKGKRITHDGNRCMRWNIENCTVKSDDSGRIRPVKPKRKSKRIDGVVAAVMGVSRLMVESIEPEPSISFLSYGGR